MSPPIRVLLLGDDAAARSHLARLLARADGIEPIAEADSARAAVAAARDTAPDVILVDVAVPDADHELEVIEALVDAQPLSKLLVLSLQDEPQHIRRALDRGTSGYMLKSAADDEVVDALLQVATGGGYVQPALAARLVQADARVAREAADNPLSDREHEVLRLIALGHTNREVAEALFISVRTAETHRSHILMKLGFSSRADLVRYAIEHRMLETR